MGEINLKQTPLYQFFDRQKLFDGLSLPQLDNPYADIPSFLVSQGVIVRKVMMHTLMDYYKLPGAYLQDFQSENEALALLTEDFCRQRIVIPLNSNKKRLSLAMADPGDLDTIGYVRMKTGLIVEPVIALKTEILDSIARQYGSSEVLSKAISDIMGEGVADEMKDHKKSGPIEWEDAPVIKLVNYIFQQGISLGASDIHLEPQEKGSSLRYRVDGVLHPYTAPPKELYEAVVSRIKVLANLNVSEQRLPQDGRITFKMGIRTIDFRISIMPFVFGEGVSIRILDKSRVSLDLDLLGLEEDQYKLYSKAFRSPHGLILVAGPTGSGKSTTLCATLKIITTPEKNIITVEDPVEYEIKGIQQSPVREDIGYSFETGLRSILRHDPDIIMIGEMRDLESAEMAVRSALTGHLVFSTIHTNDSISAFTRLTDMGIKKYLVFAVLRMVLSQRLVRVLCNKCKKAENVEKARFSSLGLTQEFLDQMQDEATIYKPVGCDACKNLGYLGRKAIFEVLDAAELVKNIRDPDMPLKDLHDLAIKLGMVTLRASALRKVLEGSTSMDEVLKITADF